jgi:drug/metabolite transporter (DMT)-like permease
MIRGPAAVTNDAAVPINRAMTSTEWGLLLTMSLLWGGSFFFAGVALGALPPLTIVVLRVGLAALIFAAAAPALGLVLPRERPAWRAFFGMGCSTTSCRSA